MGITFDIRFRSLPYPLFKGKNSLVCTNVSSFSFPSRLYIATTVFT